MTCTLLTNNILQYLDRELDEVEILDIEAHAIHCKACQEILANISTTYSLIGRENNWHASPEFYHRLTTKKQGLANSAVSSIVLKWVKSLAVAASIGLGIIIGSGEDELIIYQNSDVEISESFIPSTAQAFSNWAIFSEEDGD